MDDQDTIHEALRKGSVVDNVYEGDCLVILSKLPAGIADVVIADPPYNIGGTYDAYDDSRPATEYLAWSLAWINECVRLLKPHGSLFLLISEEFAARLEIIAEGHTSLGLIPARNRKLWMFLRHHIIWYYTFGVNCVAKLTRSKTHILHFVFSDRHHWYPGAVRVPSAREVIYADKRASSKGRLPDDTWILRPSEVPNGFPESGDVWHFNRVCGTYREKQKDSAPNQIPEQLIARIIRLSTQPGDLVVDPFAGTGTTAACCVKLDRHYLTTEISPAYAKAAAARVAAARPGDMLDAPGTQGD